MLPINVTKTLQIYLTLQQHEYDTTNIPNVAHIVYILTIGKLVVDNIWFLQYAIYNNKWHYKYTTHYANSDVV